MKHWVGPNTCVNISFMKHMEINELLNEKPKNNYMISNGEINSKNQSLNT